MPRQSAGHAWPRPWPIDVSLNRFYSHSYIFSFGIPFKQTGGYAVWNATRLLSQLGFNANGFWRHENDVVVTYKFNDKLTFITEPISFETAFSARPVTA